ncbi:unnamed protein product [Caenorhabditis angaria]|uniref:Suppressor of white apricot N-terminal domain-containing protein n=1 Tax=Caenorhabditis angaria TaxID=860376 RepID=A0A9P1IU64_9PELO|nr:unnamed protein product [Caenorhabditis angaria]
MWHEARKQEKILKNAMVDQTKRAERKKRYYDNIRKDPEQFMQVHGRKSIIHTERSIAKAAEDSNILRPWQGDAKITIDRFDARSHLSKMDLMDDSTQKPKEDNNMGDEKSEIVCEFERYRVLIINDYKGVSEKSYLRKISEKEFWRIEKDSNKKAEIEKKKKSADKKSSIGFSYDDSEVVRGSKNEKEGDGEAEGSDEDPEELDDIDVELDTAQLNPELQRKVNKNGEEYGVKRGLFCALLRADQQAQRDAAQLKQIDRQKSQLSGRESKHERMLLRQQRQAIVGKGCIVGDNGATATLLGFINNSSKKSKIDEMMDDLDNSYEDDDKAHPEFISTFGGNDEKDSEDDEKKVSVGPELPSEHYRKILQLSKQRINDDEGVDWGDTKELSSSPSPVRKRRRSPSVQRRSRSRSRDRRRRRSRSRSRERRRRYSRSRSREGRAYKRRKSRSRSVKRRRRSPSSSSSSRSRSRSRDRPMFQKKVAHKQRSPSVSNSSPSPPPTTSKKREYSRKVESESDEQDEDIKMLEVRSSMSESEKERIEIENRKRRVKLTKKMVKTKKEEKSSDEENNEKVEMARKIRQKMNEELKKNRKELEREEEEKHKNAEVEKRVREEMRYIEEQERREREMLKRRADERKRSRSRSRTRHRRSRSRSGSRDRQKHRS